MTTGIAALPYPEQAAFSAGVIAFDTFSIGGDCYIGACFP